ncbi:MFS transporter [Actinokineospora iranica]|uniref:MFS transporter, DHA2 family, methylenomycin A resistance protein n=1 Tax=Actinokineospora iranica TaxID=1271860 RepID=A0A1G6U1X5_9PSEU|nr:MFS transporter [Actinokineospora iranica]SDD34607.1 MFS transporter, DHA2 family, methylenomycin A resistance protein [Actinokineospora iranica]
MRPRLVLTLVCVATFLVYLDTSITPVAIPAINADLGAGPTAAQWLLDAYTLGFACLLLTAGSLGDRIGRKTVLVVGTAGFTLASVACALAPTPEFLIGARAAQGVFAAAVVPLSLAVTAGLFADARARARAIGIWGGTSGVALALGPLLGGLLVEAAGWRSMFWINLPIGLIALAGLLWTMPAAAPTGGRRPDLFGQTLFVLGGAALTFVLIEGNHHGWASPLILGLLGVGLLALVSFVFWEIRVAEPMLPLKLLRVPAVAIACVVNFLGLFGLYGVLFLVTVHLQGTLGLSPMDTGLRFLALFGALGAAAICASWVAARFGTRQTMVAGLLCVAVGLAGLTILQTGAGYFGYGWALLLLGIGVPLSSGVVAIQAMMGAVPPELSGTASGTMNTFRQFGAVFGVALAGILSPFQDGKVTSLHVTFLVAAVAAAGAAILTAFVLRDRTPPKAPVPATSARL